MSPFFFRLSNNLLIIPLGISCRIRWVELHPVILYLGVQVWALHLPVVNLFPTNRREIVPSTMDLTIRDIPHGSRFSIVARILESKGRILSCIGLSPIQQFEVRGSSMTEIGLCTFYDLVRTEEDMPVCHFDESTEVFLHPPKGDLSKMAVLDLCSGMGGFSIGSNMLNLPTIAFVEINQLACDALRANFSSPVIQGDLADISVLKQVHRLRKDYLLQITGGFPCQGYSRQGDQHGLDDHRSHGLFHILLYAWFLQASSVLLECVANVTQFPCTQELLDKYANDADMHCFRLTFDLQHQWPVRRHRFWAHLHSKDFPAIPLVRWPITEDFTTLAKVMPMDAIWSHEDEEQLAWDHYERAIYFDLAYGDDQRILMKNDKAPTFLHSWGHVGRDCPCGCRAAFSDERLRRGGARGFGFVSSLTGNCRHLHPVEGSLLCTVPLGYRFPMPVRSALSLLGQIAAPMQVLWLQAQILAGFQKHYWGWINLVPLTCIQVLQDHLVRQAFGRWPTLSMYQPRQLLLQIEGEDAIIEVSCSTPISAGQLASAEKPLCGWGHYAIVRCHGNRLAPCDLLHPGILYTIELRKSIHAIPMPMSTLGGGHVDPAVCLSDRVIWTFMGALAKHYAEMNRGDAPFIMYPFRTQQFLKHDQLDQAGHGWALQLQRSCGLIFVICEIEDHWILLTSHTEQGCGLSWTLYDGLRQGHLLLPLTQVVIKLSFLLDLDFLGLSAGEGLRQLHSSTCGTITLLQMASLLHMVTSLDLDSDVLELHQWLLRQPVDGLIHAGGNDDVKQQLADLLSNKGVPVAHATERAQTVLNKLGIKTIQQIFRCKNPWTELKSAASKPGTMFRLITQSEQAEYVAMRAQTKHGAQIKNHKIKKSAKAQSTVGPVQLDPAHFDLDCEHFQDDHKIPVEQIDFSSVGSDQRGVALCTTAMAQHFLENPKSISMDALALLLLDTPGPDIIAEANLTQIVIPARCKATKEHTLIFGYILQLGDAKVSRTFTGTASSPDIVDSQVVKFQIFRDQLQHDWLDFSEAPIRHLVHKMEALQLCKGDNCGTDCAKFHPGIDEQLDNVIFEIWARTFFNDQGQRTKPNEAALFSAFMRIPEGALQRVLTSTPVGVYAEPRGQQPRAHDDKYRVIWLPGASFDEAAHKCRTCSKAVCLVRLRNKYGIRVLREDERSAWATLRPGIDFLDLDIQLIFELYPLPHGTQRHTVTKLLSDWGWLAKPLQPGKGNFQHMTWRVGAKDPPPHPVMKAFKMDIVVSAVKDLKNQEYQPHLIASHKTQKHLRTQMAPSGAIKVSTDPWLDSSKDPWASYQAKPALSTHSGDGRQRIDEIKDQICTDLRSKLTQELETQAHAAINAAASTTSAASSQDEARLKALEVGMNELKGQNAQFSN